MSTTKHPNHSNKINHYFKAGLYGAQWYDETRQHVVASVGAEYADVFIDMLAATSPNQSVKGNVTAARKALKQLKESKAFSGYLPIVVNMLNIIKVSHMTGHRARFGGAKVQAFADALRGDLSAVVVDRWMLRAFGYPNIITDKRYRTITEWVNRKAEKEGMQPAQVQAAIWCGVKDLEDTTGFKTDPMEAYF